MKYNKNGAIININDQKPNYRFMYMAEFSSLPIHYKPHPVLK